MAEYIELPIETDPQNILDEVYTFLQAVIPGWEPSSGQLDVWLAQALSAAAAETRDIASAVPKSIFRWFGANLINLPPIDDTPATTTTHWTVQDNAGYTIPAGTQVSIALTGDQVYAFATQTDVVIAPGSTTASAVPVVAVTPGAASSGLGGVGTAVQLIDPLTFVTAITQDVITTGGVDAESDDEYLNRLTSDLQLLAPRPILPIDFTVFARNIPGVFRAVAIDLYNPQHNLLTLNEASAETDASGWANVVNATVASTAAQAADGVKSVSLTAIAAADMAVGAPVAASGAGAKPVTLNEYITGVISMRANTTVRSCSARLYWYTAAGAFISSSLGAAVNDSNAAWSVYTVTAQAPATAAFVRVVGYAVGAALGEVHYIDKASIRHGTTTSWVPGDTLDTGNPRMVTIVGIDSTGANISPALQLAVKTDAQARREVNFVVNNGDPTINLVDITYQVKALAGFDFTTLVTAVNAALTAYLDPGAWGAVIGGDPHAWANVTTLRYLELAQVINAVDGVDYITTTAGAYDLTTGFHGGAMARTDLALVGVAPLPDASTLTGAAV